MTDYGEQLTKGLDFLATSEGGWSKLEHHYDVFNFLQDKRVQVWCAFLGKMHHCSEEVCFPSFLHPVSLSLHPPLIPLPLLYVGLWLGTSK